MSTDPRQDLSDAYRQQSITDPSVEASDFLDLEAQKKLVTRTSVDSALER